MCPGGKTEQGKKAQEYMGGRQAAILNWTIRTGFTEERHLSQGSKKRGLAVNQKKSIPGRWRGSVQRPYVMSVCQTTSKEARVAGGKSDRKQGGRKEIHITQTYNKMP